MPKFYVYITDRGGVQQEAWEFSRRVYANIYEAENKEQVKQLLLDDVEWLKAVRMKLTKKTPEYERFITSIHEIKGQWEDVFLKENKCLACLNMFRKIEKLKYNTGGSATFCSAECEAEYRQRLDPNAKDTWNNGSVYMITHKPTGKFYVGVTTRWIMQRWWEHIKAESGSQFHKLIKDSDITDFTFEILEQFKPSDQDPYEREAYWINKLDSVVNGLNTVNGHKPKIKERI